MTNNTPEPGLRSICIQIDLGRRWDAWINGCKQAVRTFPPGPETVSTPDELFRVHFGDRLHEIDRGLEAWLETR